MTMPKGARGGSKNRSNSGGGDDYTRFTGDKLNDRGVGFEGAATEQDAFFERYSNFAEIADALTREDLRAFARYASGEFMTSTTPERMEFLRGKVEKLKGRPQEDAFRAELEDGVGYFRRIDAAIDRFELGHGVELSRNASTRLVTGKRNATLADLQAAKGRIVSSDRYISTCAADKGLDIMRGAQTSVVYKIKIPSGAKGAGIWFGDTRINGVWGRAQREFLIGRDSSFRVGDSYLDSAGNIVCELDYIGHGQHTYWDV